MGRRLCIIREILGTQIEVCTAVGVSKFQWCKYEAGTRPMPHHVLAKFCRLYRVPPSWLLLGTPQHIAPEVYLRMVHAFPKDMEPYVKQYADALRAARPRGTDGDAVLAPDRQSRTRQVA